MASIVEIVSYFNTTKQQAIVWHQQVEGIGSFAAHKALNEYYDSIEGLLDDLSESSAGIFGRLKGYEVYDLVDFTSIDDIIKYYRNCYDWLAEERKTAPQESFIQNQLDEIAQLLGSTLYKLTLK